MSAISPIAANATGCPSDLVDPSTLPSLLGVTVLQVTPALDTGGVEQTTLDLVRAIREAGGRALVASTGGGMEGELAARGGELVRLPVDAKNPLTMLANAQALKDLIQREKISLVHIRSRAPAFAALWAARATDTPVVTTYHGVYGGRTALKRWYNGVMTRGDHTIANSDYTRDHVLATHPVTAGQVTAIPRGVDLSSFDADKVSPERIAAQRAAFGLSEGETRASFLLAGRLTRWKGQGLIVAALAAMDKAGAPQVVVVFAGSDQGRTAYSAELKEAARAAGVAARVRRVGHVADMPAAYLACDFALAPSLAPEAFGRTAVEPQAMGRPVLAARHGAATETVADGLSGWLVAPGSVAAWAEAMTTAALTTPAQRAAMGREGCERVRRLYSLKTMCARTLQVYRQVLKDRA
jgi:glycosyltransferase involved in cell wall biosynthesis